MRKLIAWLSLVLLAAPVLAAPAATPAPEWVTEAPAGKRVGIIGLDTSHAPAFAKGLNAATAGEEFRGYRIVAAFPGGSEDLPTSRDRVEGFTKQLADMGVEIVDSIPALLERVDAVMLLSVDGRVHLQQALPVLKARKRMFIDKPLSASLAEGLAIFRAAEHYGVPVFSASSLRYMKGAQDARGGSIGEVVGANAFSPAWLEPTHPDLIWYGVHGTELLFTMMGTGCKRVMRVMSEGSVDREGTDVVVGDWGGPRLGVLRGLRTGKADYGGTAFGTTGILWLDRKGYTGYLPLAVEVMKYFETGEIPVEPEETIEMFAFMTAAQESSDRGGVWVDMQDVIARARAEAEQISIE